jgi:hypothetical protein
MDGEGHCSFGLYYALQESGFEDFASSIFQEDRLVGTARPSVTAFLLSSIIGVGLVGLLLMNKRRRTLRADDDDTEDGTDASKFSIRKDDGLFDSNDDPTFSTRVSWKSHWRKRTTSVLTTWEDHPVVTGYAVCLSIYFWVMLIQEGFCHPINNPSLGPNAVGLSNFGINNPALIVYQRQWFRLLTSNILVSGLFTFGLAMVYLWLRLRHLEQRMSNDFNSPWLFVTVAIILATIINSIFCLASTKQGASCTAIPLLMALQAFHLAVYWNSFVRPYLSIGALLFDFTAVTIFFPFNSWVMMLTALFSGPLVARVARRLDSWLPGPLDVDNIKNTETFDQSERIGNKEVANTDNNDEEISYETMDDQRASCPDRTRMRKRKFITRVMFCSGLAISVLLLVPMFITLVASPNKLHSEPFYTGCKLFYTTSIDDLSSYVSNDDDNKEGGARRMESDMFWRWLAEDDHGENMNYQCASFCVVSFIIIVCDAVLGFAFSSGCHNYPLTCFCVISFPLQPHIVTPIFKQATKRKGIPISRGTCPDQGYDTNILDKTFSALSYSLDVELYGASYNNGDND